MNGVYADGPEPPASAGHLFFSRPDLRRTTDRFFRKASRWPLGGAAQQTVDRWSGLLGETKNEEEVHLKHFSNISKLEMKQIPLWMREKGIS